MSSSLPRLSPAICAVFLLSGTAALVFETLWFRLTAIAFGSSAWASALVLSSFMAGLALGNGLVARYGDRIRRPVRLYALLELTVAASGVALVWVLPAFGGWLAPLLEPILDRPALVNPARFLLGWILLVAPASAMGATLPLLVKRLYREDPNFGAVLGKLYGFNTLGAMAGAVMGEAWLIERVGVEGTALAAGGLNVAAAAVALGIAAWAGEGAPASAEPLKTAGPSTLSRRARVLLAAAGLAGALLLALEVIWFRFLKLFVYNGSLSFSLMLAVVLAGIGCGGLAGGAWMRRRTRDSPQAGTVAFASGAVVVVLYALFPAVLEPYGLDLVADAADVLWLSLALIFPVALLSGTLFTLIGASLAHELESKSRAAGLQTLANTLGAGLGSLAAGFLLLPWIGMERSFFAVVLLYGLTAATLALAEREARRWAWASAAVLYVLALAAFPHGLMRNFYFGTVALRFQASPADDAAAIREGRTETLLLLRARLDGATLYHRLVTDGFSMSDTRVAARRYMKYFAYFPAAFHTDLRQALLISYGIGSTAQALSELEELERIDVVDISRDVLQVTRRVYGGPGAAPLDDPRVRVHVEDGRYFLQSTARRYDLITGEPPPPDHAGVVALYTQEHFQLVRDRLTPGGLNTYWLPVHKLSIDDTKAIVVAYCRVFEDCSLWTGGGENWMLVGSAGFDWTASAASIGGLWSRSELARELEVLGFEGPEQLGATFMADAEQLEELTGKAAPLVDNWPHRVRGIAYLEDRQRGANRREHRAWMDPRACAERFSASSFVLKAWPDELRRSSLRAFAYQAEINRFTALDPPPALDVARLQTFHEVLTETDYRTLPAWMLDFDAGLSRALASLPEASSGHGGLRALARAADAFADRDFAAAAAALSGVESAAPIGDPRILRLYAFCMAEPEAVVEPAGLYQDPELWDWLASICGRQAAADD